MWGNLGGEKAGVASHYGMVAMSLTTFETVKLQKM